MSVHYLSEETPVVLLQYEDLVNGADLRKAIGAAYGEDGLGVLAVRGVPGVQEKRMAALPMAFKFAQLPDEKKKEFEVPPFFQRGWDHGHESMKDGTPDTSKGSFYFNPLVDEHTGVDEAVKEKYPTFFGKNVFPSDVLPEFEGSCKALARLIIDVGKLVAKQVDAYVASECDDYPASRLGDVVEQSTSHVTRLLHYFAKSEASDDSGESADNWCGWHNDHGSLTGLAPAIYHAPNGDVIPCPDATAGLYIKNRKGDIVRARCPGDVLLFQIGETAQVHSGGVVKATPHMVRAANVAGVSRSTMAVFMEPDAPYDMKKPASRTLEQTAQVEHLPEGVPRLQSRWNGDDDNFGDFGARTIQAYYQS
ncbi:MAG: hypothetical protein MHM6MM_005873 [Cercozoa sp. M6MM]